MRYVSIDIETTGLDPEADQIIEFAAVIDDTARPGVAVEDLPSFSTVVDPGRLSGDPFAIDMNREIISVIARGEGMRSSELAERFASFLRSEGFCHLWVAPISYTVAGKNFASFDGRFLDNLPGWRATHRPRSRVLDPGSMWLRSTDDRPPDLAECVRRADAAMAIAAGGDGSDAVVRPTEHRALADARDVVRAVRGFLASQLVAEPTLIEQIKETLLTAHQAAACAAAASTLVPPAALAEPADAAHAVVV